MFGMFRKKAGQAKEAVKKDLNRDQMQAITGAAILVAGADGELEASELAKVEQVLRVHPSLQGFGTELQQTMQRYKDMLEVGFRTARLSIMREIADVKHSAQQSEDVLITAIEIAEADGEIEPEEMKVLDQIANTLGLSLKSYM